MFSQKSEKAPETNILRQKREEFRAEIRRRNNEEIFRQKRQFGKPFVVESAQVVLAEFEAQNPKKFDKILALTQADQAQENLVILLKYGILQIACQNMTDENMECIFGTLGNLSTIDDFQYQDEKLILASLETGLQYLTKETKQVAAVDNILIYFANLCDKSGPLSQKHLSKDTLLLLQRLMQRSVEFPSIISNIYYALFIILKESKLTPNLEELTIAYKILSIGMSITPMTNDLSFEILTVLSYLVNPQDQNCKELILKNNIINFLVDAVKSDKKVPTLTIITKITMYEDTRPIEQFLEAGFLDSLNMLMNNQSDIVRRQAALILSNICFSSQEIIQQVMTHQIFQRVLNSFIIGKSDDQAHSMVCLVNILQIANQQQYQMLHYWKILDIMIACLQSDHTDLLYYTLGGLGFLCNYGREIQYQSQAEQNPVVRSLKVANALSHLERLQHHKSLKVYQAVDKLLVDYFDYRKS